jgi:hypothetical protein
VRPRTDQVRRIGGSVVLSPVAAQLHHRPPHRGPRAAGRLYSGHRVVLLWDGLSAHWSTKMRTWLDSQHDWLTVERLPAYAPS